MSICSQAHRCVKDQATGERFCRRVEVGKASGWVVWSRFCCATLESMRYHPHSGPFWRRSDLSCIDTCDQLRTVSLVVWQCVNMAGNTHSSAIVWALIRALGFSTWIKSSDKLGMLDSINDQYSISCGPIGGSWQFWNSGAWSTTSNIPVHVSNLLYSDGYSDCLQCQGPPYSRRHVKSSPSTLFSQFAYPFTMGFFKTTEWNQALWP